MTLLSMTALLVLSGCENTVSGGWTYTPFKGPGFARGGIFDRFVVEQDGSLHVFQDVASLLQPSVHGWTAPFCGSP